MLSRSSINPYRICMILVEILVITAGVLAWLLYAPPPFVSVDVHLDRFQTTGKRTENRVFDSIPILEDLSYSKDDAWSSLTTPKGGFLWVQLNETNKYPMGISMFHGLHCLQLIRGAMQKAYNVEGGKSQHVPSPHGHHEEETGDVLNDHIMHCFGYLVQSLQCSADGTIEPANTKVDDNGKVTSAIEGLGIHHVCRNSTKLWEIAAKSEVHPVKYPDLKDGSTVYDTII